MADGDSAQRAPLSLADKLFAGLQRLLPTRLFSRGMHWLAGSQRAWLKCVLIGLFRRLYAIDLAETEQASADDYPSFNAFFTRALRPGARPLPEEPDALACPVDGRVGAHGEITTGRLTQAKGISYTAAGLLQSENAAAPFLGGAYATLYLAPHNYHRVHMPITGTLRETRYIPGRLFGVNPTSVRSIPRLFTRNERLACLFDTALGPMAVVLVGAFCVGGIETVWSGAVTPPHRRSRRDTETFSASEPDYIRLQQGDELGRFNLGSTVILLFGGGAVDWSEQICPGRTVHLNDQIGRLNYGV